MPDVSLMARDQAPEKGNPGWASPTGLLHNCRSLRRFSRALTGTQPGGDAYVVALLETVIADLLVIDDDAANEILTTIAVPIIFITAFPERLLTGQKPEPAFLVTKPFMPDMLKAIIGQALFFDTRAYRREKVAAVGR